LKSSVSSLPNRDTNNKKGQAYCIAPLQLYALASIKTWGIKRSWSYRAHPSAKVVFFMFYANVKFIDPFVGILLPYCQAKVTKEHSVLPIWMLNTIVLNTLKVVKIKPAYILKIPLV
jgi:hypothetical protein